MKRLKQVEMGFDGYRFTSEKGWLELATQFELRRAERCEHGWVSTMVRKTADEYFADDGPHQPLIIVTEYGPMSGKPFYMQEHGGYGQEGFLGYVGIAVIAELAPLIWLWLRENGTYKESVFGRSPFISPVELIIMMYHHNQEK